MCIRDRSEFIRRAIQGASIRPVVTVSPVNDELLAALGKLTAEYGKIGSNLNQIARAVGGWHNPYPQLAAEVRAASSDPVSYTHLDVYKRQGQKPSTH